MKDRFTKLSDIALGTFAGLVSRCFVVRARVWLTMAIVGLAVVLSTLLAGFVGYWLATASYQVPASRDFAPPIGSQPSPAARCASPLEVPAQQPSAPQS